MKKKLLQRRILVLTDDMPWGHRSIAKAIYDFLKKKENSVKQNNGIKVDYVEVKMPLSTANDIYTFMYRYFPSTNKLSKLLMENNYLRDIFLEVTDRNVLLLKKVINKYRPDLIICSYFLYSHSLSRWKEKENKDFELWTVVADPWTSNPISFVKNADLNLVYDGVAYKQAISYGIKKENILKTGWWTRQEMYNFQKTNLPASPAGRQTSNFKLQTKKEMGIEEGEAVVFIGGGSLGTNAITKFLPVLLLIKQKCTIIFNTGTDKVAFKMVEQYKKIFEKINIKSQVKIINLGWIENMAEVLSISDIVFGKAGPNFLFDVVAAHKPFVAITHIGGQEDGNIDLILKKKLGWVKEGLGEAEDFLLGYLKNPKKYNTKFAKTIEIEAKNNSKTMEKIWNKISHKKLTSIVASPR